MAPAGQRGDVRRVVHRDQHSTPEALVDHALERRLEEPELRVREAGIRAVLRRDDAGSSRQLLYSPRMRTNGASSVK